MILRALSLMAILYALLFALFAVTLGTPAPADAPKTDAIVVLTGGKGRIERGIDVLGDGKAERLLVSGADPSVRKRDLVARLGGKKKLFDCCVDLDSTSVDTRSNADEAQRWMKRRGYDSVRLVTSDWHMRRAEYEFKRRLGDDVTIIPDAVRTAPGFATLFMEYNKYWLRRVSVWLDI